MKDSTKFTFKIAVSLALFVIAVAFVAGAANGNDPKIEGSWKATVTAVNPPVGSFAGLITFGKNNTVIESRRLYVPETPFGPILETPAHGEWVKTGAREYQANYIFLIQGAPDNEINKGQPIGTDNISLRVTVSRDGTQLNGTFQSQVKDEAGNVIFGAEGNYNAARIEAAP